MGKNVIIFIVGPDLGGGGGVDRAFQKLSHLRVQKWAGCHFFINLQLNHIYCVCVCVGGGGGGGWGWGWGE